MPKSSSIEQKNTHVNLNRTYFSNSADMSFEGDTSEGSKNSNSNDGGGGADADLVYFDESEMRFAFLRIFLELFRVFFSEHEDDDEYSSNGQASPGHADDPECEASKGLSKKIENLEENNADNLSRHEAMISIYKKNPS